MKQIFLFCVLFFLFGIAAIVFGQLKETVILGKWQNENKKMTIEFYKSGATYSAKIVQLAEPTDEAGHPRLDVNNPDPQLRQQPLIGTVIVYGLIFDGSQWKNGTIYLPKRGITANCSVHIDGRKLKIEASKGFYSETKIWSRL